MNADASRKAQRFLRLEVMRSGDFHYADLLLDEALTAEEKVWVLEQRIQDLCAELRASEENMTSDKPGDAAEKLREAQRTLQKLQELDDDATASQEDTQTTA